MKTIKIFGKDVCSCVIIRIVLSTMAIIALLYLTSCVTPSSVRGKKDYSQETNQEVVENRNDKRKKVEKLQNENNNENINDDEFAELIKQAHQQNALKLNDNPIQENQNNENLSSILMPLSKQIDLLTANQNQIKHSITGINAEINTIRNDVSEIKETLNLLAKRNTIASTGIEELEKNNSEKKKENNQFLLKSDEDAEKDPSNNEPLFVVQPSKEKNKSNQNTKTSQINNPSTYNNDKQNNTKNESINQEITDINNLSFELTESYLENKDYSKAIVKLKEIETGLKSELEKNKHSYLMGESYFGLQQYAKAVEYFIKVLETPDFGNKEKAKLMIAESQIKSGEPESAKETYKQLIADYPDSKHIPRARKMLQKL